MVDIATSSIAEAFAGGAPGFRRLSDIVALAIAKAIEQGRDEIAEYLTLCYNDILKQDSYNKAARREGEELDELRAAQTAVGTEAYSAASTKISTEEERPAASTTVSRLNPA